MRTPPHRRGPATAALLWLCLLPTAAPAQTDAIWLTPTDGDWSNPANWSTDPLYPNNDSPTPGDTYNVTLDAAGTSYRVTLYQDITVDRLTLNASDATLRQTGGTFTAIDGLDLQAGTYEMFGGTLANTHISGGVDGELAVDVAADAVLDGVTLASTMRLANFSQAPFEQYQQTRVVNGMTLDGGNIIVDYGSLHFYGDQTLSGQGMFHSVGTSFGISIEEGHLDIDSGLTFGGTDGFSIRTSGNATLTSEATLLNSGQGNGINLYGHQTEGVILQRGLIDISDHAQLNLNNVINEGQINVTDGYVQISDFQNTGQITMINSDVSYFGAMSVQALMNTQFINSTVNLHSRIDNTAQITDLAMLGDKWRTVNGPTTLYADENKGRFVGGTVFSSSPDGVIVPGQSNHSATNFAVAFENTLIDTDVHLQNNTTFYVYESVTLANGRQIIVQGGSDNHDVTSILATGDGQILGDGEIVFESGTTTGNRIHSATPGSSLTLGSGVTVYTNGANGTIGRTGHSLLLQGLVSARAAGEGIAIYGDNWVNEGILETRDGGRLWLHGPTTLAALGTIRNFNGGGVYLYDTFDNTGNTFNIDDTTGDITVYDATIEGGAIHTAGDAALIVNRGTFNAVDFGGLVKVRSLDNYNRLMTIAGDTVFDDARFDVYDSTIVYKGNQAWTGAATFTMSGTNTLASAYTPDLADVYALQLGAEVDLNVVDGAFSLNVSRGTTISSGRITVSKTASAALNNIDNHGVIEVIDDGKLTLFGDWSNSGVIRMFGQLLTLGGSFSTASLAGFQRSGGTVRSTGVWDNTGATFTLSADTGNIKLSDGRVIGGTLDSTDGMYWQIKDRIVTLEAVTLAGSMSVDYPVYVDDHLTVDGELSIKYTLNLNEGSQLLGHGSILFDAFDYNLGKILPAYGSTGIYIGQGLTIATGTTDGTIGNATSVLVNEGVIVARTPGEWIYLYGTSLDNTGTLRAEHDTIVRVSVDQISLGGRVEAVDGGIVEINGDWTNTGVIALEGGTVKLGGSFTLAELGTVERAANDVDHPDNAGTLAITGTLDNTDGLLMLNGTIGDLTLDGATILGGTLIEDGARFRFANNTGNYLDSVTWVGDLNMDDYLGKLRLRNGSDITGNIALNAGGANLIFDQDVTFDRPIDITLGGATGYMRHFGSSTGYTLTLGADVVVHGANADIDGDIGSGPGRLINYGLIRADVEGQLLSVSPRSLQNFGTIRATNGGQAYVAGYYTETSTNETDALIEADGGELKLLNFTNYGLIQAINHGRLIISARNTNQGLVRSIDSTVDYVTPLDDYGSVEFLNTRVRIVGTFTPQQAALVPYQGNTFAIGPGGVLNNTDNTLTLNAQTGSWHLDGGRINGGTIDTADGAVLGVMTYDGSTSRIDNLNLLGHLNLDDDGRLYLSGSTATFGPTSQLTGPGHLSIAADTVVIDGQFQHDGWATFSGDVLQLNRSLKTILQIMPGSRLELGPTPRRIELEGWFEMVHGYGNNPAELAIRLGGTAPGTEYDQLTITGGVSLGGALGGTLGGTLEVSLIDGYQPGAGEVFEVVTYGGQRSGRFEGLALPGLDPLGELALAVLYDEDPGGVEGAVAVRASVIGDANVDDRVSIADLVLLSQNYGKTEAVGWAQGDFNQDGQVSIADLVLLSQRFGRTLTAPLTRSTPEPAAAWFLIAATLLGRRRRRR